VSAADEQAREVEVRLVGEAIEDAAMRLKGRDLGTVHRDQIAREALAALEPIRAAEREEAAREALLAAADALGSDPSGAAALETFRADDGRMSLRVAPIDQWLRDRADGVTGRSETTLPIHRTEAGWPDCSTCDGGGCPDCTDPA
jgi:hypothetical protein